MNRIHTLCDSLLKYALNKQNQLNTTAKKNRIPNIDEFTSEENTDALKTLLDDGYIEYPNYGSYYNLTTKGKKFIQGGGYENEKNKEREFEEQENRARELSFKLSVDQIKTNRTNRCTMWITVFMSVLSLIISGISLWYSISSNN